MKKTSPQLSLPLGGRKPARTIVPEESHQRQVVNSAHLRRYLTLETNEHRRPAGCCNGECECEHHFTPAGGNGRQAGIPDVLISHMTWPPAVWLGLEIKGSHTRVSPEQQRLAAMERVRVVRGWDQARDVIGEFETWRQGQPVDRSAEIAELQGVLVDISAKLTEVLAGLEAPARPGVRLIKAKVDGALRRLYDRD